MDRAIYRLLAGLSRLLGLLPPVVLRKAGRTLGEIVFWIDRRHRVLTRKNLRFAFGPEVTETRVHQVARDCYRHLGQVVFEAFWLMSVPPERLLRQVSIHGLDNARQALEGGAGVIFLASHCGNWELTGLMTSLILGEGLLVGRPLDFKPLDRLLVGLRTRFGHKVIPDRGAMRPLIRELRSGGGVGILLDQDAHWRDSVVVPFFGRPSRTNKGIALLWSMTGSPIVPVFSYFEKGRWHVTFGQGLELKPLPDKTKTISAVCRKTNAAIEAAVRRHPEQWLWMHHRWRPYYGPDGDEDGPITPPEWDNVLSE